MKTKYFSLLLLLVVGLLSFSGCDDDDNTTEFLNYDGPNFTAPTNPAGLTTYAAYFPASVTQDFVGRRLSGVDFWLTNIPQQTVLVIYGYSGNEAIPGDELYRIDLTQRVSVTGDFTSHLIPGGLDIPADGLWLTVETTIAADGLQSIGCDQGENYSPNGDRMFRNGEWTSFNTLVPTETVNWNIRGVLATE